MFYYALLASIWAHSWFKKKKMFLNDLFISLSLSLIYIYIYIYIYIGLSESHGNPGSNTPQNCSCTDSYIPFLKPSK